MVEGVGRVGRGGTARACEAVAGTNPDEGGINIAIAAPRTAAPTRTQTTKEANQAATLRTIFAVYGRGSTDRCHSLSVPFHSCPSTLSHQVPARRTPSGVSSLRPRA